MPNYELENNLLLISAHADDELKVAGTLLEAVDQGMTIYQVILTDSSRGPDYRQVGGSDAQKNAWLRRLEHRRATELLGIKQTFRFRQTDLRLRPEVGL